MEASFNLVFNLKTCEMVFVPVILIYILIRKPEWRKDKAGKNLKKFQLFRFVSLMTAFVFYLIPYSILIMVRFYY